MMAVLQEAVVKTRTYLTPIDEMGSKRTNPVRPLDVGGLSLNR